MKRSLTNLLKNEILDLERRRNPYWQYKKAWRELRALKGLEPKTWWRIARFRLHPAWINHICQDKVLPRQQAKTIYQHYSPGCTLSKSREQILMRWENVEK